MWFGTTLVCLVLANNVLSENTSNKNNNDPITVSQSGRFVGSWMETRNGRQIEAYRGIRYVEPPVGKLRFLPPKPILEYKEEVDARKDGPSCPQPTRPDRNVQEDCLTLNVYMPKVNTSKPFPVIIFIHPGGFYSMTGRSDLAGPHYLLEKDLVLVTINYRLASLGFLATGDKHAPGNNGMKDQVAAMRWVQRNIRAFGGDPNLVTITGDSAGSHSVLFHMLSPMSKGLFHRGIAMSGSPLSMEPLMGEMLVLARKQAELVNCTTTSNRALLDCLRSVPASEMGKSLNGFYEFGYDPVGLWKPVVEPDFGQERFLIEQPLDSIKSGRMHAVPIVISQTSDEFFWKAFTILKNETLLERMNSEWDQIAPISFMLPRKNASSPARALRQHYLKDKPLRNNKETADCLGKLYGDAITGFPVYRMARIMANYSPHPVFYAEFAYIGNHSFYEDPVTKKPVGVAHHDDMIYLFTIPFRFPPIPSDSPDNKIVRRMTALWYNFARYGDPNPKGDTPELSSLSWPAMKPGERQYLRIGNEFSISAKLKEDRFKVWDQLYPISYE